MCPYSEHKGFTTDIARHIFQKAGYQIEFIDYPWARAAANTLDGTLDGVLSAGKEETPLLLFPTEEIAVQSDCFYGKEQTPEWTPTDKASSFKGKRVIIFKGWVNEARFQKALGLANYKKIFNEFYIDIDYNTRVVDMINKGRADAFWMDINVFGYFKRNYPEVVGDSIKNLGCIKHQKLYLALTPERPGQSKKIAQVYDQGIKVLRRSGELSRIMKTYGLSDWR